MSRQLYVVPEHEFEATLGLPEKLPADEYIRWQGSPDWKTLAIEAFHVRKLAIYFVCLLMLRAVFALYDGASVADTAISVLGLVPLALIALGAVCFLAWLTARTAVYTITNQRVVMRIGIVLSVTFNLPFASLNNVGIKRFRNGAGDLPLTIGTNDKIAYLHLWPHARPWRFANTEPMMRSVFDVANVANILSTAMAEASGGTAIPVPANSTDTKPNPKPNNINAEMANAT
jgi:Bacterial PH domain